jgi:DNA-binding NarL/FixJ family response regulator
MMRTEPPSIRVVLADDHNVVRQGLRALLDRADDIAVVGEAEDGYKALQWVEWLEPDVLVADIAMPRLDGLQTIERVRKRNKHTKTVILSMHSSSTLVRQALRCGASGYIVKRSVTEELLLAVRSAHRGDVYLSPSIAGNLINEAVHQYGPASAFDLLTSREREVLQLITEGHTNTAIAQTLQVGTKTVEKHRSNLMRKLDVHDVAGLLRIAIRERLVFLDDWPGP